MNEIRMGQKGQLTGIMDRHGVEIRIGDTLRFDCEEYKTIFLQEDYETQVFVIGYENGELQHPGTRSDLSIWCEIIPPETSNYTPGEKAMVGDLVDRLRGRYPMGPHLPNGEPEFGWRQFGATPINLEAADEIEKLRLLADGKIKEEAAEKKPA